MLSSLSAPSPRLNALQGQTVYSCVSWYVSGTTTVYKNTCPYIIMSMSVILVLQTNAAYLVQTLTLFCIYRLYIHNIFFLLEMKIIFISGHFKCIVTFKGSCEQPRVAYTFVALGTENISPSLSSVSPPLLNCGLLCFLFHLHLGEGYRRAGFPTVKGALSNCFLIISRACCETASAGTPAQGSDPFQAHTAGLSEPAR